MKGDFQADLNRTWRFARSFIRPLVRVNAELRAQGFDRGWDDYCACVQWRHRSRGVAIMLEAVEWYEGATFNVHWCEDAQEDTESYGEFVGQLWRGTLSGQSEACRERLPFKEWVRGMLSRPPKAAGQTPDCVAAGDR